MASHKSTTTFMFTTAMLLLICFTFSTTAVWEYRDVIQKATGFKTGPKVYNRTLFTPGTPGVSNWMIGQWGNAYELGAFNNQYTVANPSSRVVYTPSSNMVELALNGNLLACDVEANLFAAATTANTYDTPPAVPAIDGPLANNGKQLYHTLTVKPIYMQQVASTCLTQGSFLTSFVMKNYDAPSLTVFYQLSLQYPTVTPAHVPAKNWFFNGITTNTPNTWGYDDTIDSFGYTYPAVGQTLAFAKDVKPRLRAVIADTANNIPAAYKNVDRWYVSSAYYGPHVWGGVLTTYQVSNFRLAERWVAETPCGTNGVICP